MCSGSDAAPVAMVPQEGKYVVDIDKDIKIEEIRRSPNPSRRVILKYCSDGFSSNFGLVGL